MPVNLASLREDQYTFGAALLNENILDYKQGDYDFFKRVIEGDSSTGIQIGALFAQDIVLWTTAFEFGILPTVVVKDKTGKYLEDPSNFANNFLKEQHCALLEIIETKNSYGDAYLAFNMDRNIESIEPSIVDPGFLPYSNKMASASVKQTKYVRNIDTGRKVKIVITRNYDDKQITYSGELQTRSKYTAGIKVPEKAKVPNPLGVCPIMLLPNLKKSSYMFGWSDIHWAIPMFEMFHKTFIRGFESQQYSGKPILGVTGINGDVATWIQKTFKIDPTQGEDINNSSVIDWFKRHRMLCLAENVKAEFIESKLPIGKTLEILDQCIKHVSRITSIPEFIFGHNLQASDASVREQYTALKAKIVLKQAKLVPHIQTLLKWAMVWYSTYDKNEETGEIFEKIGLVNDLNQTNEFQIDLIWPDIFGSDGRLKLDALTTLVNGGAISRLSLARNFQQYIPNPETEIETIKKEQEEFDSEPSIPQTSAQKNSKERTRKNKSTIDNEDDTPEESREK